MNKDEQSMSQKMRFAIQLHYEFDGLPMEFEEYYKQKMQQLIEQIYIKLDRKRMGY